MKKYDILLIDKTLDSEQQTEIYAESPEQAKKIAVFYYAYFWHKLQVKILK